MVLTDSRAASSSGNNFAEIPNSSVLSGRVWLDANDNGTASTAARAASPASPSS